MISSILKGETVEIATPHGIELGVAPLLISASRATDIPAFHTDWFLNRLRAGYCVWLNPFNQKKQYISFSKVNAIVFWTKNPRPLLERMNELDSYHIPYYFQFTLNDYESEKFEPSVPTLKERIGTFQELSNRLGKHRVIWRFDPILLTDTQGVDGILEKIYRIGEAVGNYTEKLVISFADIAIYAKVKNKLKNDANHPREPSQEEMIAIAEVLQKMELSKKFTIASCCEHLDLSRYGITHNQCIDQELLQRIVDTQSELFAILNRDKTKDNLFGSRPQNLNLLKDSGQRNHCGCIASKDIGQYNTCFHHCVYCYANTSQSSVAKNAKRLNAEGETILQ